MALSAQETPTTTQATTQAATQAVRPVRRRRGLGLRAYIAVLLAIAIAPVGAMGVWQTIRLQGENDTLRNEAYMSATLAATARKTQIISENFGLLASVSTVLPITANRRSCNRLLATLTRAREGASAATAVSAEGDIVCRSAPGLGITASGGAALAEQMAENPRPLVTMVPNWTHEEDGESGGPETAVEAAGESVLVMAYPIIQQTRYAGFVTLVAPRRLVSLLGSAPLGEGRGTTPLFQALFDPGGAIYAVTSSGQSLSDGPSALGVQTGWLPPAGQLADWAMAETGTARRYVAQDGVTRAYVVQPVIEGGLNALVAWPVAAVEQAAASRFAVALLFPIAMWTFAVAVAFIALNTVVLRNVLSFARAMHSFSIGRREARVRAGRYAPSELVALGDTYNRLADRVVADEQTMAEAIEEKNTLLREVYHRVKNNLQLIVSMTNLQIRQSEDERERQILRRLQGRVQGLALVHQRLYEARSLAAVRVDLLLEDLLRRIREVQDDSGNTVRLMMDTEPLTFAPDQAVPIALFATEAIENAFKHGIGAGGSGQIGVTLKRREGERVLLEIWNSLRPHDIDDGPVEGGTVSAPIIQGRGGLGLKLLEAFARQLHGTMSRESIGERHRVTLDIPLSAAAFPD
ncbi:MAG: sensor histidine kinase [Pseudomonadota bacterium]